MKINYYSLLTIIFTLTFISCGNDKSLQDIAESGTDTSSAKNVSDISDEVFKDIIKGIPSPLEISSLIKESGAEYAPEMLNSTDNAEGYSTNYKKALNLGILGTDLGYVNLYGKTTSSLGYLSLLNSLAEALRVGQFFEFTTLKRLASNNNNIDSLLNITTTGFEDMNNYLIEQKRGDIGVLILVGGWLEALHIAIKIAEKTNNARLIERVGEQKIILNELLLLLAVYKGDKNIAKLEAELNALKTIYNDVNISYEYAEPEMVEVDGMLMIIDKSSSKVNITPELFNTIAQKANAIRTGIIS
jgi:hypothetical protein